MFRNRILSLVALLMLAVVSVNGQILKDLDKYNYRYCTADELTLPASEGILIAISPINPEQYISKISTVETAMCCEEKDAKKFLKKARKLIKKEKIPLVQTIENERMTVNLYARQGEIIVLSYLDEIVAVTVIK